MKNSKKEAKCPYCNVIGKTDRHGNDNILNCSCGRLSSHPKIEVTDWKSLFTMMILIIGKII